MTADDQGPPTDPSTGEADGGKDSAGEASKGGSADGGPSTPMPSLARKSKPPQARELPTARTRRGGRTSPDRALQDIWVARLREGCTETLAEVVGTFTERLTAVVGGILRDRDAVEDVVQQTFIKAYYRIHSFKGNSSLYTWLYRVAVNATKDYIKSRKRRPAASLEDLATPAALLPQRGRPQIEGLERRELRVRIHGAIARLPVKFRTVLALREIDGMAYHEIASVLNLSLGTVESRLFRARRRLRTLLSKDPELSLPGGTSADATRKGRKGKR